MTKDELRAELERQEQRYKDVYGGEVTTYAAQPEPERKPWRKRASLLDQMVTMREELRQLWLNTSHSREQLTADLQAWCQRAEASGITALREFSLRLRAAQPV